jgi:dienelactone hydrolase
MAMNLDIALVRAASAVLSVIALLGACSVSAQSAADGQTLRPVIAEQDVPVEMLAPVASDGFVGEAFLRKPPGAGPFPAVILVHGGAPRWSTQMLRDFAVHTHASRFLEAGYVVVAMTRRDLDLNLPTTTEQPAVRDALAVYDHVKALPYVDADSVVVRGTSVGGYLTLEVAAARDVTAIMVEEPFSFPFVGLGPNAQGGPADSSKIARIQSPMLDIEGDQTPNINDFNRDVFFPAILAAGKSLAISHYPGGLHSFAFYDSMERTLQPSESLRAFAEIDRFFRRYLAVQPQPLDAALVSHEPVGW